MTTTLQDAIDEAIGFAQEGLNKVSGTNLYAIINPHTLSILIEAAQAYQECQPELERLRALKIWVDEAKEEAGGTYRDGFDDIWKRVLSESKAYQAMLPGSEASRGERVLAILTEEYADGTDRYVLGTPKKDGFYKDGTDDYIPYSWLCGFIALDSLPGVNGE